jgi:hypothetical protein
MLCVTLAPISNFLEPTFAGSECLTAHPSHAKLAPRVLTGLGDVTRQCEHHGKLVIELAGLLGQHLRAVQLPGRMCSAGVVKATPCDQQTSWIPV